MMAHVWNRSTFPALQEVFCSLFSQHSKIWPRPLHPYLCSTLGLQGLWGESPFHQRSLSNLKLWRWNCQHDKEEWSFPGLECKGLTSPLSLVPFPFSCYIESWSVSHWMSIESPAGRTRPRNSFNFSVSYLTGKQKFPCPVFFFWQLYFFLGWKQCMMHACRYGMQRVAGGSTMCAVDLAVLYAFSKALCTVRRWWLDHPGSFRSKMQVGTLSWYTELWAKKEKDPLDGSFLRWCHDNYNQRKGLKFVGLSV